MLLRRVARPMLAAIFIQGGIAALKSPQGHVQAAKPVLDAVTPVLEKATDAAAPTIDKAAEAAPVDVPRTTTEWLDDETLVKIDGGVKVVAGTMLALGKFPRLASTALAASLVPTTLAGHRFWEETDPEAKQMQQIHFFKNVGLLGGLLIAAADTEGKPSLGWRGRKAAKLPRPPRRDPGGVGVGHRRRRHRQGLGRGVRPVRQGEWRRRRRVRAPHRCRTRGVGRRRRPRRGCSRAAPGRRGQLAGVEDVRRAVEEGLARLEAASAKAADVSDDCPRRPRAPRSGRRRRRPTGRATSPPRRPR